MNKFLKALLTAFRAGGRRSFIPKLDAFVPTEGGGRLEEDLHEVISRLGPYASVKDELIRRELKEAIRLLNEEMNPLAASRLLRDIEAKESSLDNVAAIEKLQESFFDFTYPTLVRRKEESLDYHVEVQFEVPSQFKIDGLVELGARKSKSEHFSTSITINEKRYDAIIDTGASNLVIPYAVARELNLPLLDAPQSGNQLCLAAVGNVPVEVKLSIVDAFTLGSLKFGPSMLFVYNDYAIQQRFAQESRLVVGWNFLKGFKLIFERGGARVFVEASEFSRQAPKNFSQHCSVPLLLAGVGDRINLPFHFDSGAFYTEFSPQIVQHFRPEDLTVSAPGYFEQIGLGGRSKNRCAVCENIRLQLGNVGLSFSDYLLSYGQPECLRQSCGIFGLDILEHGTLTLDFESRSFSFV